MDHLLLIIYSIIGFILSIVTLRMNRDKNIDKDDLILFSVILGVFWLVYIILLLIYKFYEWLIDL